MNEEEEVEEVEEEEGEEESVHQAYQRFLKARDDRQDENFTDSLLQYKNLPDGTAKLNFINNVMLNDQVELFECILRLYKDEVLSLEDDKLSTMVHHTAMNNHPSFLFILACLQEKEDIELDEPNYYNQTPIMLACLYGHEDVLDVFLRYAPHVGLADAIDVVQLCDNDNIMEMLLEEQDERQAMKMFRKIRLAAADMKEAKYLQDFDGCAGETFDKQLTFMSKLIEKNEMEMFNMLLRTRAEILSARDEDGWTILHNAVSLNSSEAVNTLLKEQSVDVDAVDYMLVTPLMLACRSFKHKEVLAVLLEGGCNVLLKDNNGWNALDIAKRAKQRDILALLEEHLQGKGLKDNGKLAGQYL